MANEQLCLKKHFFSTEYNMNKSIIFTIFLILLNFILVSCNNLSEVSLSEPESMDVNTDIPTPVSLKYISASELDMILNETMGPENEILFTSDGQQETFVVFEPNTTEPVKMAQVRKIANSKGSAVVVLGLETDHNPESITKAYSYEFNKNMAGFGLYTLGKEKFLGQFQNRFIKNGLGNIDGITGATPIWKPISEQINEMAKNLIQLKHNPEFLEYVKTQGNKWQPDSTLAIEESNIDSNPEYTSAEYTSAASSGDWLFIHWRLIGMSELSLLIAGLFIMIFARLKESK